MPEPFSDTTSPSPVAAPTIEQAALLAARLGMEPPRQSHLGRWETTLYAAMHSLIDRLEAMEKRIAGIPETKGDTSG